MCGITSNGATTKYWAVGSRGQKLQKLSQKFENIIFRIIVTIFWITCQCRRRREENSSHMFDKLGVKLNLFQRTTAHEFKKVSRFRYNQASLLHESAQRRT